MCGFLSTGPDLSSPFSEVYLLVMLRSLLLWKLGSKGLHLLFNCVCLPMVSVALGPVVVSCEGEYVRLSYLEHSVNILV